MLCWFCCVVLCFFVSPHVLLCCIVMLCPGPSCSCLPYIDRLSGEQGLTRESHRTYAAMLVAIRGDSLSDLVDLLDQGLDVNALVEGQSLLSWAVRQGSLSIVGALLQAGARQLHWVMADEAMGDSSVQALALALPQSGAVRLCLQNCSLTDSHLVLRAPPRASRACCSGSSTGGAQSYFLHRLPPVLVVMVVLMFGWWWVEVVGSERQGSSDYDQNARKPQLMVTTTLGIPQRARRDCPRPAVRRRSKRARPRRVCSTADCRLRNPAASHGSP